MINTFLISIVVLMSMGLSFGLGVLLTLVWRKIALPEEKEREDLD